MREDWAESELAGASLRDRRRVKSVIRICESLAARPELSFSAACGPAVRQAAHRIFKHEGTSVDGLLEGHYAATAQRCEGMPLVLIAQDTCVFVYNQEHIVGLGSVNGSERSAGLLGHAALAMTPEGTPLGLWHVDFWGVEAGVAAREQRREARDGKESCKWFEGLDAVSGRLPEGTQGLLIQDREADIFDLLAAERSQRLELLVRASHDRTVDYQALAPAGDELGAGTSRTERGKLFAVAASAPVAGLCQVRVLRRSARRSQPARPAREAELEVRVTEARLQRPRQGSQAKQREVTVWIVCATEMDVPAREAPVHWVLVCTLPVEGLEMACQMLGYYARRWLIERLHYTLKSGLGAEKLQIDDAVSLAHALALYYVVAWRLLHLTYTAREDPDCPASEVLDEVEVTILQAITRKPVLTVADAVTAIAKLAGYEHYRNAPPPGVKRLWMGRLQLDSMVMGWRLARGERVTVPGLMIHG